MECGGASVDLLDCDVDLFLVDVILTGGGNFLRLKAGGLSGHEEGFAGTLSMFAVLVRIARERISCTDTLLPFFSLILDNHPSTFVG